MQWMSLAPEQQDANLAANLAQPGARKSIFRSLMTAGLPTLSSHKQEKPWHFRQCGISEVVRWVILTMSY